jgi:hypothetical protein
VNPDDPEIPSLHRELDSLLLQKHQSLLLHSNLKADQTRDLPSPSLTSLINKSLKRNIITHVQTSTGTDSSQHAITQQFTSYFSNLYTVQDTTQPSLPMPPSLSKECKDALNHHPTRKEIESLINDTTHNTAPGLDGIPYRTYLIPSLLTLITRLFIAIWNGATPPASWLHAAIRPIPKPDKDPSLPSSYRPISLLNTDYKLFTGVYNQRLQPFLTSIFPPHQTGFIKGRSTHLAALRLSHHLINNPLAQALLLDFEKAYDRVVHKWLFHVLSHMGFPPSLTRIIQHTHINSIASLIINNRLSPSFPTPSGVRQGDPLSPILFNISLEPLLIALDQSHIFNQAHADDTAIALSSLLDTQQALHLITTYESQSGAHLNHNKSIFLSRSSSPSHHIPFTSSNKTERYLGFGLKPNGSLTILPSTIPSILSDLTRYKRLPLTYASKASILSSYIRPRIQYQSRICTIPMKAIKLYTSMEYWFMSSQTNAFSQSHRYMPPPALNRYHPSLSYRLKPFTLSITLMRATFLPSIYSFDPSLLPFPLFPSSPWLPLIASSTSPIPSSQCKSTSLIIHSFQSIIHHLPHTPPTHRKSPLTLISSPLTESPPSPLFIRKAVFRSLSSQPITFTPRQHKWINICNTSLPSLWKAVQAATPRQAIITFTWKLLNGTLPLGGKFGNKCVLCNHKTEHTNHLLNANCIHLSNLLLPISEPLPYFLIPPHDPHTLLSPLIIMFSIWLTRNAYLHSDNQHTPSISPLFHSILKREVQRLLLLHPDYSQHIQDLIDFLP